jgi:dipeptidyl aminopeptidase/acylaminoacyl peptidase
MRRLVLVLIVFLFYVFLFSGCETGKRKTSLQAFQDKIVFVCGDGLCIVNPDGSDLKRVASSKRRGAYLNSCWSSDKGMIGATVFVRKMPQILLIASDGSRVDTLGLPVEEEENVKVKRSVYFRGWVGEEGLLFSTGAFENARAGVMDTTGEIKKVLRGNYPKGLGGHKIAYLGYGYAEGGMGTDIMVFDLEAGKNLNLTGDGKIQYFLPTGSPDGQKIAFAFASREEAEGLWIINSDGKERKLLATKEKDYEGIQMKTIEFSPDSKRILFLPDNGDQSEIYVVNIDGTGLKGITGGIAYGRGGASWSPDGTKIVFTSNKDGNEELYIINADGTGLFRLTQNEIGDCCSDW